nr:glycoside hydrolase family 88 protein [Desmospora activa]
MEKMLLKKASPMVWAETACDAMIATYTPAQLPPANRWHYHQGVFLHGMNRLWEKTAKTEHWEYMKAYVDHLVDDQGNLVCAKGELDSIQAGLLLLQLFEVTKESKYRSAAERLYHLFPTFNRTREGGYWHKDKYPYQMWLDGLYMGGLFSLQYGRMVGKPEIWEDVLHQFRLMTKYTKDEKTGLLYHAWDESRQMPWSDPETGRSPEFWGRAIGWYGMVVVDFLAELPDDAPGRPELLKALTDLIQGLIRFQDKESGLWYQVVDKGDHPDNWLETSCSSLFVYTIAKAITQGYIDARYRSVVEKGFQGLLQQIDSHDTETFVLPNICIGTGVGDYKHYVNRSKCENDLHGVGAFVLACVEVEACLRHA